MTSRDAFLKVLSTRKALKKYGSNKVRQWRKYCRKGNMRHETMAKVLEAAGYTCEIKWTRRYVRKSKAEDQEDPPSIITD